MHQDTRNKYFFGLGTIGRDMFYTTVSMYLLYYLTEILDLPDSTMWGMTIILTVMRVFDALNDPFMGLIVDNTRSRLGKFKPNMALGAVLGAVFMVAMFTDLGLRGTAYLAAFALCYLGWDIFYGINDIAYWSMLPSLSLDGKAREKTGAFARICGNIGMYVVVVGILPLTGWLTAAFQNAKAAWFSFALFATLMMLLFQLFTLFGVRERRDAFRQEEKTTLRDMARAILHNDQLLYTTLAMGLFMIGYMTTTTFGTYFFKYAYGDEGMYAAFALILGVAQLSALMIFPFFSRRFDRRRLYRGATLLVLLGYGVFFFSPMNILPIGVAGLLMFIGQAFIQLLMLMFLADTIEYGQLKLGRRNEAVTFSVQPLINKLGGAVANGIVGATVIVSGINRAASAADVTPGGIMLLKAAMLILPLICILLGYFVYARYYKIDESLHKHIVEELAARGDIRARRGEQP
ncbi:MAG: glycoside-pentoside-hexuronide (GPH):cation symporter [Christensenellales bacterium]